jgi:hypothetical protein
MNANILPIQELPILPIDQVGYWRLEERLEANKKKWKENGHFNNQLYEEYKRTIEENSDDTHGITRIVFSFDPHTKALQAYRLDQQPMDRPQIWITMYKAIRSIVCGRQLCLQQRSSAIQSEDKRVSIT